MLALKEDESVLRLKVSSKLGILAEDIADLSIVRRSIDSRKGNVQFVYTVDVEMANDTANARALKGGAKPLPEVKVVSVESGQEEVRGRVVVIGCGPAGLFAALELARHGYKPLLIERGGPVAERHVSVGSFCSGKGFDPESNILFGAGGAGTYSDGKLTTRIRDPRISSIFAQLVAAGAQEEILIDARPHIGTDRLHKIVESLCADLLAAGGEIAWHTRMTGLEINDGRVAGVITTTGTVETNCVLLAAGANGRDTFELLEEAGVAMAPKPFQMGLRIEHPRELIDEAIYGRNAGHPKLGAADYVLSSNGVAAFCVCPGGSLVAASVEPNTVCTNGMSGSLRNGAYTNTALVTTIYPETFGEGALDGLGFQRYWEELAFERAGGSYAAPAQSASDYCKGICSGAIPETTYPLGVAPLAMSTLLPDEMVIKLGRALKQFDKRIPGFAGDKGVLVGPETRASCPVRILRDKETRVNETVDGLYPCGEGSGYSSGITSSAVDGLRSAQSMISRFAPLEK
jgi:uncharacterized protein